MLGLEFNSHPNRALALGLELNTSPNIRGAAGEKGNQLPTGVAELLRRRAHLRLIAGPGIAGTERRSGCFRPRTQQASERRSQDGLKERRPLQYAMTGMAFLVSTTTPRATPEAFDHGGVFPP